MDDLKEKRGYWKLKKESLGFAVENWLWKSLLACNKTNCRMNESK
jgi:hypothetical protein